MESNGNNKGRLLTAGGILSIVAGIYLTIIGVSVVVDIILPSTIRILPSGAARVWYQFIAASVFLPFYVLFHYYQYGIIGGCVGILGIVAILGGISAIKRWRFGMSLAGAICALPSVILGIPAVILVALAKREFNGGRNEDGN